MYPGRPATEAELKRWLEAAQKKAETEAKLRAGAERYAPATPALAAAEVARNNRLEEMRRNGESSGDGDTT
jgi:hypothetical protein